MCTEITGYTCYFTGIFCIYWAGPSSAPAGGIWQISSVWQPSLIVFPVQNDQRQKCTCLGTPVMCHMEVQIKVLLVVRAPHNNWAWPAFWVTGAERTDLKALLKQRIMVLCYFSIKVRSHAFNFSAEWTFTPAPYQETYTCTYIWKYIEDFNVNM